MLTIDSRPIHKFWNVGQVYKTQPFGDGHINDTWLIQSEHGQFIMQRVNRNVFKTKSLVYNYNIFLPALYTFQQQNNQRLSPVIIQTKTGNYHYSDQSGSAWRLAEFVPESKSYKKSPSANISYKAAYAFGKFQCFLNTLKPFDLEHTIDHFHDLAYRYNQFNNLIKNSDNQLIIKANREIRMIQKHGVNIIELDNLVQKLPTRIIHNDTKLNNLLFKNTKLLVIDLDTVMPGKLLFDFGDMIRSYTSPAAEDETDLNKVYLRTDHFIAIFKGYLDALNMEISSEEKKSFFAGAKYIILEQAIRFLMDFLDGNNYYKTSYPNHNLIRTRTQIKLLESLVEKESELNNELKHIL